MFFLAARTCSLVLTSAISLSAIVLSAVASAEIDYRVKVNSTEKRFEVAMVVPAPAGSLSVQIPNWSPGAYFFMPGGPSIHDLAAIDIHGRPLTVTQTDQSTWSIMASGDGPVTFRYWISTRGGGFGRPGTDDSFVQLSGPSTYMYVVGRKKERCQVTFDVPTGWPVVVGLDRVSGPSNTYGAPTYDVLADNPMSTGQIIVDHYNLRGKEHYVVLEGAAKSEVNREKLLKDCRFVSAAETDFWGGAPYHKYVWHFSVYSAPDGAGGLEHLSSTQIGLASGEGQRAQSVLSHEYFHLWNVKRIRAKVLGPFDYETLPKTGALWWLEGVTDYYAWLLPYRYGEWELPTFYNGIIRNYTTVERNPAHLTVSPNDASLRVGETNGGRGNSNGYQISYYNLGWLCGLCLDTEIRAKTNGKRSLDDVIHGLYDLCKNDKPGFEEDEIRKQCIRFGGPTMGDFYDRIVMKPGELPIAEQLAKMGLKFEQHTETYANAGFEISPANASPGGPQISSVGPSAADKLMVGDLIQSINGNPIAGKSLAELSALLRSQMEAVKVGTPIVLVVTRAGQIIEVSIDPVSASRPIWSVSADPAASPAATALGTKWLMRKTPAVQ